MRLPPLPDTFGNYALGDFTEIAAPSTVSWWPQTAGWAWLGAALAAWCLYRALCRLRRWRRDRYRREARRALRQLATTESTVLAAASELLKRTALAAFGRREVAPLHGDAWVDFLNSRCPRPPFDASLAGALASGQYRGQVLDRDSRERLLEACEYWIMQHRGPRDV